MFSNRNNDPNEGLHHVLSKEAGHSTDNLSDNLPKIEEQARHHVDPHRNARDRYWPCVKDVVRLFGSKLVLSIGCVNGIGGTQRVIGSDSKHGTYNKQKLLFLSVIEMIRQRVVNCGMTRIDCDGRATHSIPLEYDDLLVQSFCKTYLPFRTCRQSSCASPVERNFDSLW